MIPRFPPQDLRQPGPAPTTPGSADARRRKLFVLASELDLTRDERIELASYQLRRDITSWKDLDDDEVLRLLDSLEGCLIINSLLALRPDK